MCEIPLLTREQEISLAKKIEIHRKLFRRAVLGNDFSMRQTVEILKKVYAGALPFDRTIKVSLTERLTKEQITGRMPHNLKTLDFLMDEIDDFLRRSFARVRPTKRKPAKKQYVRNRHKCLVLVEELSLRSRRVQPFMRHWSSSPIVWSTFAIVSLR